MKLYGNDVEYVIYHLKENAIKTVKDGKTSYRFSEGWYRDILEHLERINQDYKKAWLE